MATATARRGRTRAVSSVGAKVKSIPEALAAQIVRVFTLNTEQNEAKRTYDSERKVLLGAMQAHGRDTADVTAQVPDGKGGVKTISLTATVAEPEGSKIDVAALLKLVPMDEKLIDLLKINVSDVEKVYGKATLARVSIPTRGEVNVSVKPTK